MNNYQLVDQILYGQTYQEIVGLDSAGKKYFIPDDPANTDYQNYLDWLEQGNTPTHVAAPPEPLPLTTEQKIAAAGFDEGELEDFLVAKIQTRLNE